MGQPIGVYGIFCAALVASLTGCPSRGAAGASPGKPAFNPYKSNMPSDPFEDWYPESISPPEGTRYPYLLAPLPDTTTLPGLDRPYINHVMSQMVIIARANLRLIKGVGTKEHSENFGDYNEFVGEALENIEAEDVPEGLRQFQDDLTGAIALQLVHFEKVARIVEKHMEPVYEREALTEVAAAGEIEQALKKTQGILEGEAASAKLTAAWSQLSERYADHWTDELRESIYSHFRVLDL